MNTNDVVTLTQDHQDIPAGSKVKVLLIDGDYIWIKQDDGLNRLIGHIVPRYKLERV